MSAENVYGKKDFGFEFEHETFYLRCDRNYARRLKVDVGIQRNVEKLVAGGRYFRVNPVEPINLPSEVSRNLMLEFDKPVSVEPSKTVRVYLKFPVEIAVLVDGRSVIDVFTLRRPKYALYGVPGAGVVCRYFLTEVHEKVPDVNGLFEGVMELEIVNGFDDWVEVRKAVFDGYGMKIYYSSFPAMVARMKVESRSVAETSFVNRPMIDGMEKAVELYVARKFMERKKFVMEWGF